MRTIRAVTVLALALLFASAAWAHIDHGQDGVDPSATTIVENILQLTGDATAPIGEHDSVQCWGSQAMNAQATRIYFTRGGGGDKEICYTTPAGADAVCFGNDVTIDEVLYEGLCTTHANVVRGGARAGWVVFQRENPLHESDDAAIWIMDANGGNVEMLTANHDPVLPPCEDPTCEPGESKPQVSPDGTRIVFRATGRLFVMAMDGTGVDVGAGINRPLLISGALTGATHHLWGDNDYLYFKASDNYTDEECGEGVEIFRVQVPTTVAGSTEPTPQQLTEFAENPDNIPYDRICANWPSPSPDGLSVVYHVHRYVSDPYSSTSELRVMDADGSNDQLLIGGEEYWPCGPTSWSPNGEYVAFKRSPLAGDWTGIALVKVGGADDGTVYQLTYDYDDRRHWFLPDGSGILFKDHSRTSSQSDTRDDETNGGDILVASFTPDWVDRLAAAQQPVQGEAIPTLGSTGVALLAVLTAAAAVIFLRRRMG